MESVGKGQDSEERERERERKIQSIAKMGGGIGKKNVG